MHLERAGLCFAALLLAGCAGDPEPVAAPSPMVVSHPALGQSGPGQSGVVITPTFGDSFVIGGSGGAPQGTLARYIEELRNASCPAGSAQVRPMAIELRTSPVPLQAINPGKRTLDRLTYLGGWHLTSPNARLGGLSDLKVLPDGNLLSVDDEGHFVWIDLDADGLRPVAARMAPMLDGEGRSFTSKSEADAEGLAFAQGVALVSFERDHRVLAYDLARCEAAARGARVDFGRYGQDLPGAFARAGITVGENEGPEPLAVTPNFYLIEGLETIVGGASPLSVRPIEAAPDFILRIGQGQPPFVGADVLPDGENLRLFSLHRSFTPTVGNVISIVETKLEWWFDVAGLPASRPTEIRARAAVQYRVGASQKLADMNLLLTIDNFEGIAARRMPDGKVRLYIVSDDNFSASQRTLLMAFELPG